MGHIYTPTPTRPDAVTPASRGRISRIYVQWIGYDALAEGVEPRDALRVLREYREERCAT